VRVEEEYADVLQNIEAAIVAVFDGNPSVVDRDVLAAIDALIGAYKRERRKGGGVTRSPPGRARAVYEQCRRVPPHRFRRFRAVNRYAVHSRSGDSFAMRSKSVSVDSIRSSCRTQS